MDHDELYELHCKGQFEALQKELTALKAGQAEVLAALKGGVDKPGLCERVRDLERVYRRIWAGVALLLPSAILTATCRCSNGPPPAMACVFACWSTTRTLSASGPMTVSLPSGTLKRRLTKPDRRGGWSWT